MAGLKYVVFGGRRSIMRWETRVPNTVLRDADDETWMPLRFPLSHSDLTPYPPCTHNNTPRHHGAGHKGQSGYKLGC